MESYLSGPTEKALARQKSGTVMSANWGARSAEDARQAAVTRCEKQNQPCEAVMVNDRWLGPAE